MIMQNKVDFEMYAKKYDNHRTADSNIVEIAINNCSLDKSMRILDFGCGTGNYLEMFHLKGYHNLFGLDQSEEMCKIALEKTKAVIKKGSHIDIPFEDAAFDAVIITDVVHFIDDIENLFKSLQRICKKNGFIFISTQSHEQLDARIYAKYFPSAATIDKLRHHETSKLIETAKSNGFSLYLVQDYLSGTEFLVDKKYFDLIQNKAFYILGLLSDEEFRNGMEILKSDMKNGSFIAKFAGRTLITMQKKEDLKYEFYEPSSKPNN